MVGNNRETSVTPANTRDSRWLERWLMPSVVSRTDGEPFAAADYRLYQIDNLGIPPSVYAAAPADISLVLHATVSKLPESRIYRCSVPYAAIGQHVRFQHAFFSGNTLIGVTDSDKAQETDYSGASWVAVPERFVAVRTDKLAGIMPRVGTIVLLPGTLVGLPDNINLNFAQFQYPGVVVFSRPVEISR